MKKSSNLKAFSIIELSVVILIIGVLVLGVPQGSRMMREAKLKSARSITSSSPVASIDGLAMWLEATSEKSFNSSEAVNTAIGSAGTLNNWYDINPQTTSPNNASQTTSDKKPRYIANAINGLPAVHFDGTDDCIVSNLNIDYSLMPNLTMFIVYKTIATSSGVISALFGQDNGGFDRFILINSTTNIAGPSSGSGVVTFNNIKNINVPQILTYVSKNSVTNGSSVSINGNVSTNFTENHSNSGANNTTIGGISDSCLYSSNAYISEVIVFNRGLNDTEKKSVESYLSQKWGVPIS